MSEEYTLPWEKSQYTWGLLQNVSVNLRNRSDSLQVLLEEELNFEIEKMQKTLEALRKEKEKIIREHNKIVSEITEIRENNALEQARQELHRLRDEYNAVFSKTQSLKRVEQVLLSRNGELEKDIKQKDVLITQKEKRMAEVSQAFDELVNKMLNTKIESEKATFQSGYYDEEDLVKEHGSDYKFNLFHFIKSLFFYEQ